MRDYWRAIFDAWQKTIVTEHEYFIAPAIYTPQLVERTRRLLAGGGKSGREFARFRPTLVA